MGRGEPDRLCGMLDVALIGGLVLSGLVCGYLVWQALTL